MRLDFNTFKMKYGRKEKDFALFASKIKVKIYQFFTRSDKFSAVLQRAGFAESSSLQGTDSLGEFNLEICSEGS